MMLRVLSICLAVGVLTLGALAKPVSAQTDSSGAPECKDCEDAPTASTTFIEEFKAVQAETLAEIHRVAEPVPEARQTWRPVEGTPSVLDLCNEIASLNARLAQFLLRERVASPSASTVDEALQQVENAFQEVDRGVDSIPSGKKAEDIHVDTSKIQATMREVLMRYATRNARLLGQLEMVVRLAAAEEPTA